MNTMFRVLKVTDRRTFQAKDNKSNLEDVDVVGLILRHGTQDIYAEAYRKQHDKVVEMNIAAGDTVGCRLSSYVQKRQNNGVTFFSTHFVVDDIDLWLKCEHSDEVP